MHVVAKKPFEDFARKNLQFQDEIRNVYKVLKVVNPKSPEELKAIFPSLDRMKYRAKWWVIDIANNRFRMMFFADFEAGKVFVKHLSTHAEYDRLVSFYRSNKE